MLSIHRSAATPTRLIGRLAAEMALHVIIATRRSFPAAFDAGATIERVALFLTLLRHADGPLAAGRPRQRPLSVAAMAASMGIPFETARRNILGLIDHGLASRVKGGIILAPTLFGRAELLGLARELHDVMVAQIDDLQRFEVPMPTTRAGGAYRPAETLTAVLDTTLGLLDHNRTLYGSGLSAVVVNAIIIANIRHITYDPVLAHRHSRLDTIPPDHLRVPVRTSALARTLGIPYSTVAREVERLSERGLMSNTRRGLVVWQAQLARPAVTDNNRTALVRAVQVVQRLRQAGFRFEAPSQCYLVARPPPIAFE